MDLPHAVPRCYLKADGEALQPFPLCRVENESTAGTVLQRVDWFQPPKQR